jgi:O-antigen/teichoic acid export membrane protein
MRIIVGATLGPIAVVLFTTLRTLTRLISQASAIIAHASEPEMAAAYGNRETTLLRKLYIHTTQLTSVMTIGMAVILYCSSDFILEIWTHGKVEMDYRLLGWLMAGAVISTFWRISLIVLKAANLHLRASIFFATASALSVLVAYCLLSITGRVSDVGFILLIMDITFAAYVLPFAYRLTGDNWQQFFRRLINPEYGIRSRPNDR